jgi:putative acyl-CoA dehydrogenase
MRDAFATHAVFNQSPPFEDINLFASDAALAEAVEREGGGAKAQRLAAFGAICGSAEAFTLASTRSNSIRPTIS